MIKTNFPINDLLRRKLQTSITIATLTLSVASTLFLLLFTNRLGFGATVTVGSLTQGLTAIFSQFTLFIGVLIFVIGAVLTSFVAFLMMTQRTRDFGLIKAAGCPNSLVGGYLMAELLTTTLIGCILGVGLGFLMDYSISYMVFSGYQFPNFWFLPLVFVAFFVLSFSFGLQPILKAARMSPMQALSPVNYYGLTATTSKHRPLSHSALTWRIATRSLFRRQSASIRIIVLLSIVFLLLTFSVAGGIIARDTTTSWVQKTVDKDTIAIAHNAMGNQYRQLLFEFSGVRNTGNFDYSDSKLAIPDNIIEQLNSLHSVSLVDARLILKKHIKEVSNFTIFPDTERTVNVGDDRQGDSIVVGVNPQKLSGSWYTQGQFLTAKDSLEAVVGDSIAHQMYSSNPGKGIVLSDPLVEGLELQNSTFDIIGVCVDPLNNGLAIYVPIEILMNITSNSSPNLLLVKLSNSTDRSEVLAQIKSLIQSVDPDLNVFILNDVVAKNTDFLASAWQTIMLLPIFTLVSAMLCLVGYLMLAVDEQHHAKRRDYRVLEIQGGEDKEVQEGVQYEDHACRHSKPGHVRQQH
ncbi:MAG: FtsX-like permease family protein, partial [Candidatus Bathyarchaeia archaeon]